MVTVNDLYRKIKEISSEEWNPRPVIAVSRLSETMTTRKDQLMPLLTELTDLKLIKFDDPGRQSIKLTLLGTTVTRTKR